VSASLPRRGFARVAGGASMPVGGQPRVDPRRRRSTKERDTRLRADTHHLDTELHIVHTSRWRTFSRSSHLTAPLAGIACACHKRLDGARSSCCAGWTSSPSDAQLPGGARPFTHLNLRIGRSVTRVRRAPRQRLNSWVQVPTGRTNALVQGRSVPVRPRDRPTLI